MRLGPADREVIRESRTLIFNIMSRLSESKKLNPNYKQDLKKVFALTEYPDKCAPALAHLDAAITSPSSSQFLEAMAKHGISTNETLTIYSVMLLNQYFSFYAYLGNILVALLKDVEINEKKVKGTESLGVLLDHIKTITTFDLKETYVNDKFRNALGHGWYWVKNEEIHYYTNGKLQETITISLADLLINQIKLWHFVANWSSVVDMYQF